MRNGVKVLIGLLAVVGAVMLALMIIGVFHWIVIGAVVLGIGYVAIKLATSNRKSIGPGEAELQRQMKSFERETRGR